MAISDKTLVQRWQREADSEAFSELVRRHSRMTFAAADRILRNSSDAEEVVQDAFLKLGGIRRLRGDSIAGLLHTIATHLAINRLKAESRRREREIAYATLNQPVADSDWPVVSAHVDEAIASLSGAQREAVVRHFLEAETYRAIADSRGVDESTVRHHAQRGLETIRRFLKRRGIAARAVALAGALSEAKAEALPAPLLSALGRQAVAGPTATGLHGTAVVFGGAAIMTKKLVVGAGVAVVVAASVVGWRAMSYDGTRGPADESAGVQGEPLPPETLAMLPAPVNGDAGTGSTTADGEATAESRTHNPATERAGAIDEEQFASMLADAFARGADQKREYEDSANTIHSADVPEDNGMHYFLKAWELLEHPYDVDPVDWEDFYRRLVAGETLSDDEWAQFNEMQEALELIRYGIEVGNITLPIGKEGPETPLPFLAVWRQMARIMNLKAEFSLSQGDYATALNEYQTIVEFGNDLGRGGPLINGLVGVAVINIGTDSLMALMAQGELTADEYRAVIASLQDVQANALPHWETLMNEQAYTVEWFEDVGSTADALRSFLSSGAEDSASSEIMFASLQSIPDEDLLRYFNQYREDYERLVQYSSLPYYEAMPLLEDADAFTPNVISNMILPAMGRTLTAYAIRDARLQGAITVAAVEAYRVETGSYPYTLDALLPGYLAGPAIDPFTGLTLRYQLRPNGYRLYSAGSDMTDNGGLVHDYKKPGTDLIFHK